MSVIDLAHEWLALDRDPTTRAEIQGLLDRNDEASLAQCLRPRIAFGTAGLRARVGAGFARMNALVVIQTSQGLAQHILDDTTSSSTAGGAADISIVVGHDARRDSARLARLAAAAFAAKGLTVRWLGQAHTPLVPFTVVRLGAAGGVVVTASHNPKEDNGYKVYTRAGTQINSPDDQRIAEAILANLAPLSWDDADDDGDFAAMVDDVFDESVAAYNEAVAGTVSLKEEGLPRFVYTPLHGVGFKFMAGAFAAARTQKKKKKKAVRTRQAARPLMELVSEQTSPDADFPTVRYPNPEEHGALDLAKSAADTLGIDLIIANDPDADRFAAAEKVDGQWHQFKGDDLGVMLGYHLYQRDPAGMKGKTMLTSAVSSQMLGAIGRVEGFDVEETLTGFKWIGNRAREIGPSAVFGYEEALGYMIPEVVFDKDGIATAMLFLEMCSRLGSPYRLLQGLYAKYGYFETFNTYWKSPSVERTAMTVSNFQALPTMYDELGVVGAKTRIRDLMTGVDTGTEDGRATLWNGPTNQMVTVWVSETPTFKDGVRYTVRASGTEPKIKVYIECRSTTSASEAREGASTVWRAMGKIFFNHPELQIEERFSALLEGES